MVSDYRERIGSHMRTFTCFYIVWDSFHTDIGNHNNYCITTSLEPSAELHYSEVLLYVRTVQFSCSPGLKGSSPHVVVLFLYS